MQALATTPEEERKQAEALVGSLEFPPELAQADVQLYTDATHDPAFLIVFSIKRDVDLNEPVISSLNAFVGRVQTAILHSELKRFPYTRFEQLA